MDDRRTPERDPSGRFLKGRSGNPKGRPRKPAPESEASAFEVLLDRTLTVTRNGEPQAVTVDEALQHRTYQQALAGSRMAWRTVLKMIERRDAWIAKHKPAAAQSLQVLWENEAPRDANEALCLLGIAVVNKDQRRQDPEREPLLLEPWAVEAALKRRRGRAGLSEKDLQEVRRCTRAPETIRWPRPSDP